MTKHVRKEHPAESIQEEGDAECSDVEASEDELDDESDEIKEEPQNLYPEHNQTKKMHPGGPTSEYSRNLWPLPGQTAHRPSPLHLQSSTLPRSEVSGQEIKLERVASATPQRSFTDPIPPDDDMQIAEFSLSRANTMPNNVAISTAMPQSSVSGSMAQQYQYRNPDNLGLWTPQYAFQASPTSLSQSSPRSAGSQAHPMCTSQPYQLEQLQYSQPHEVLVSQQPLDEMTVHEIHLDPQPQACRDMAPTPVHQNPFDNGLPQHMSPSDSYIAMSREVSRYQDELPPTPASSQQLPHYTTSLPEAPYQAPQYVALHSFSTNNQAFPPHNGIYQYNEATNDWWKDAKLEANGFLLPAQRVQEYGSYGA